MENTNKAAIKAQYKEKVFPAGVFLIRNHESGKVYIGCSPDIQSMLNRLRTELEFGSCRIAGLQSDWKELGADSFAFETLDILEPPKGEREASSDDLAELLKLWLVKEQPWDERGYNTRPKEN